MPAAGSGKTKVIALTFTPNGLVVLCVVCHKKIQAIRVRIECDGIKLGVHLYPFLTQYLLRTVFRGTGRQRHKNGTNAVCIFIVFRHLNKHE